VAIAHERRVGNLPATLTSFVGRKQEITDIRVLLTGTTRLVTLTGAGGVGKTRLAIEAAARLQQARVFDDGVWLVELAALSDPRVLAQTVAAVFQLQEEPERDFVSVLIDALSARYMLLILDNCEHLVDACATFAHSILRSCPRVSILATSREPLGIDGETTRRVPSLPRPDPARLPPIEQVRDFPAVRLFADRGAAVMRDFSITQHNAASVAHVCDRLDGIPLALELAAARIRALSVEQIVERSTTVSASSPAEVAPRQHASRRWKRRSPGATTCCRRTSGTCCVDWRCSPVVGHSMTPSPFAPIMHRSWSR